MKGEGSNEWTDPSEFFSATVFSYTYYEDSGVQIVNGFQLSMSLDYYMANFGNDSTRVELEFQFSVATSDGQSLTENFKLIINGPINYCTDVKPIFSCQSSSCQVEQVFLYPDNSGRTLTMLKKAN